jgi:hypothetical protein
VVVVVSCGATVGSVVAPPVVMTTNTMWIKFCVNKNDGVVPVGQCVPCCCSKALLPDEKLAQPRCDWGSHCTV